MRFLITIVLLFATSGARAAELTASELRDELVGQVIQWWESDGWHSGNLTLLPDGRAVIAIEQPRNSNETGRWLIRDNQICTTWTTIRDGEQKCYSVNRLSGEHFVTSGGDVFRILSAGA